MNVNSKQNRIVRAAMCIKVSLFGEYASFMPALTARVFPIAENAANFRVKN